MKTLKKSARESQMCTVSMLPAIIKNNQIIKSTRIDSKRENVKKKKRRDSDRN